jgi:hypothetical protein
MGGVWEEEYTPEVNPILVTDGIDLDRIQTALSMEI